MVTIKSQQNLVQNDIYFEIIQQIITAPDFYSWRPSGLALTLKEFKIMLVKAAIERQAFENAKLLIAHKFSAETTSRYQNPLKSIMNLLTQNPGDLDLLLKCLELITKLFENGKKLITTEDREYGKFERTMYSEAIEKNPLFKLMEDCDLNKSVRTLIEDAIARGSRNFTY